MTKQSFLKGAIILTIAGIIVRILGAAYRIPLGRLLTDVGLGIYAAPNQFYLLFFTLSSAGIPVAVSRIVAEKIASGQPQEADRVFKIAQVVMITTGTLFSLFLFLGAGWLIRIGLVPNPASYYGLKAVAPVILLAAIISAYRGLFQGTQNMTVVAISQVADQFVLFVCTVTFCYLFLPKGLTYAAAAANFGAVPGALTDTLLMVYFYSKYKKDFQKFSISPLTSGEREHAWSILRRIFETAIPISFASVSMAIAGIIDNKLILERLQLIGYSLREATAFYGQLNQMAMPFVNTAISLALAIGASLVPAVSESLTNKDINRINQLTSQAIKIVTIFSLPSAVGLYLLAPQFTMLLFKNEAAGIPLASISAGVIFWSIHLVTSATLQGLGKAGIPVRHLILGLIIKVLINYYFIPTSLGIKAAAYATVIIFVISSVLNLLALSQLTGFRFKTLDTFLKPTISSIIVGIGVFITNKLIIIHFQSNFFATISASLAGVLIYGLAILLLGGLNKDEIRRIPVLGPRLAALIKK